MGWPMSGAAGAALGGQGLSWIGVASEDSQVGPVPPVKGLPEFNNSEPLLPALHLLNADGSVRLKRHAIGCFL